MSGHCTRLSETRVGDKEFEALVTPRIREAVRAAVEAVGENDFRNISGLSVEQLRRVLDSSEEYVSVAIVTLACKINKAHGDTDPEHSSISECLKGSIVRLPQKEAKPPGKDKPYSKHVQAQGPPQAARRPLGPMYDQKTVKLLNFSASLITFLVLGYFLGGILLAPAFSLQACLGVTFSPPGASPCVGSVLGLALGAIGSLGYTYYYFVNKL